MNIQRSSFARLDSNGVNENFKSVKERLKKVYGKMKTLESWRKTVLLACLVALAIDPLFLFIPELNSINTCFTFDKKLGKIVCVLRTFIDTFYVIHIICYITEAIVYLDRSQSSSKGESSVVPKAGRKRCIPLYLIVDICSVLPIPQGVVLGVICRSTSLMSKRKLIRFTKWIIVYQYIPRIIRIYPLYKEVTRASGTVAESNWAGAALNLFLFLMYSYVFGAFWYVNGVQRKCSCWRDACKVRTGCNLTADLLCAEGINNSILLEASCKLISPEKIITNSANDYDFGMYIKLLKSRVAEVQSNDFPRKIVYCFWWGLQNLSTFAQGLKPGNSASDIFFAIVICASGLFLVAVLIGNVQKYLITSTARLEEMKERQRDTEKWMSSKDLPEELKERIRMYDKYKWQEFRGTEEDARFRSLSKDLRIETKRHLYQNLLKSVPLLSNVNDWLLEALCDRAKSVIYMANSNIVRVGDPVEEMLFVTKGELKCTTKYGDHNVTSILKEGAICGPCEDLLIWIRNPHLSTSNKTVMALTKVEGFILLPDDLKFVASHLDRVECAEPNEMIRSLSEPQGSDCSRSSYMLLLPVPQKSDDPECSKDKP